MIYNESRVALKLFLFSAIDTKKKKKKEKIVSMESNELNSHYLSMTQLYMQKIQKKKLKH